MDVNEANGEGRGDEGTEPPRRFSPAAKRIFKYLAFALVIHLFVLPQIGGARKALSVLGSINPYLILLAIVLEALSLGVYALLTQLLLPADQRPSLPIVFGAVLASTGVNHVVPGGAAATAAANYRLLGAAGVRADALGFALGVQAIGSAVVLNAILWLALMVSIPVSGFHPLYASAAGVGALLMALFAAAVIGMRRGKEVFADRAASVAGHLPRVDSEKVRAVVVSLADQLDTLAEDRQRLIRVIGFAAANWLFDAAALWVALSAFGHHPNIAGLLVAYGLANIMAALPISPGGLGVVEAILIPTLIAFGTPASEASIGVVAYRLVNFWLPIPVGAVAYAIVSRVNGQPRRFRTEVNSQLAATETKG